MYKIGIVEDELDLNNLVKTYIEHENYETITFTKGEDVIDNIDPSVDLWILDIMLEGSISGYDIIKKIREQNEFVPVIFTSARDQELDKIIGLELGSDDYLAKPYSLKELILRVNMILKRVYKNIPNLIVYNSYNIDEQKRSVTLNSEEIILTTLEFDLLLLLINNKNKSFSREEILIAVWGDDYFGSDRVVDDLIRRMRKKMPDLNINTIYGFGYRLS